MCDPQTFDSRDSRYKRPYGAVPSGTRVELALRPPRAGGFSAATLIAYFEHRDEERRELPMPWRGLEGDRDVFAVTLETGDYVGLVWYSFRLEGLDGRREELGPFQLTVYDGAEEVLARVLFRLTARRGAMPFLPGLGSRLHEVIREKPGARQTLCARYVAQALEEETDLSVTDVVWQDTEKGAEVTVSLEWKGQPLTVTAAV